MTRRANYDCHTRWRTLQAEYLGLRCPCNGAFDRIGVMLLFAFGLLFGWIFQKSSIGIVGLEGLFINITEP